MSERRLPCRLLRGHKEHMIEMVLTKGIASCREGVWHCSLIPEATCQEGNDDELGEVLCAQRLESPRPDGSEQGETCQLLC